MRVLVVEDEKNLNKVLTKQLKGQGYSVDSCLNGIDAMDYIESADYDVIVLDIMLPGMSGWDILARTRQRGIDSSIIMLTAMDSVEDKVRGLDEGADDYLTKPFAFEELMARIRMLTRKKRGSKTNLYEIADLKVDTGSQKVTRGGKEITLTGREFALLHLLIANKGKILSRDAILENLWDYSYEGSSNMVDVYIRYLRKKLDEGYDTKLIHTVRGIGYVLKE